MDVHEYPLRRRYALELALGLALIALAAWVLFGGAEHGAEEHEVAKLLIEAHAGA